ncbi:MAG: AAA family ATPase [Candidatus Saccharibacteria bacterium]|nr:AAA family ATPase [Candidatus Saccharibacteria bacterium]
MNGKSKPYAILVFGAPMSGKTTFADQFSARFNAPFLNLSELREQCNISRKVAINLIAQISKCKQTLVIEGGLDTEKQRNEFRKMLTKAGYLPVLVWVQTDLNEIKHRMRHKYHKIEEAKITLANSYKKIEAPSEDEDPLVISGKHTFQTQCKNVLNGLSERRNAKK